MKHCAHIKADGNTCENEVAPAARMRRPTLACLAAN
jgi:hypothetical protein